MAIDQLTFNASLVDVHEDESSLIATLAADDSGSAYLNFQRDPEFGCDDDWGVYVEFNDQCNSGYNRIRQCAVTPESLTVEFTEPIDHEKRIARAIVTFVVPMNQLSSFFQMLRRIFTGYESLLEMDTPS